MIRHWYASVLGLWLALAFAAPWVAPHANQVDLERMLLPPDASAWLGTDDLGRSIALRVIAGAAISTPVAMGVVALSLLVGTLLGASAAWRGGMLDRTVMALIELLQSFPGLLLAIALAALLGPGIWNVAFALALTGWVGFARLARAQTTSLRERAHVEVARALGVGEGRIMLKHVLPLLAAPVLVEAAFAFAATIAAEAGMSFLGLGVQPPTASWGSMLREATQFLVVAPHMLVGPGMAILSLTLAVQSAGEHLRARWQIPR